MMNRGLWIKTLFIVSMMYTSLTFGQQSTLVANEDLLYMKKVYQQTDSALIVCDSINTFYEMRAINYELEIGALREANLFVDSILVQQDERDDARQKQINILNNQLNRQKFEIWVYRGGGVLLIIGGIILLR